MLSRHQIRRIRNRLGLSQRQLADLLGVHPLTVSKWERGLLSPNAHQEDLLRSFGEAEGTENIGETVGKLLLTVGVAAALLALLKAAFDE